MISRVACREEAKLFITTYRHRQLARVNPVRGEDASTIQYGNSKTQGGLFSLPIVCILSRDCWLLSVNSGCAASIVSAKYYDTNTNARLASGLTPRMESKKERKERIVYLSISI